MTLYFVRVYGATLLVCGDELKAIQQYKVAQDCYGPENCSIDRVEPEMLRD